MIWHKSLYCQYVFSREQTDEFKFNGPKPISRITPRRCFCWFVFTKRKWWYATWKTSRNPRYNLTAVKRNSEISHLTFATSTGEIIYLFTYFLKKRLNLIIVQHINHFRSILSSLHTDRHWGNLRSQGENGEDGIFGYEDWSGHCWSHHFWL